MSDITDEILKDVARNTADINQLTHTVKDLADTVKQQATQTTEAIGSLARQQSDSHKELLRHINKQEVSVAESQKTNWQTIAGIGGVFVAIMTLSMSLLMYIGAMAITPIERDSIRNNDKIIHQEDRMDKALIEIGRLQQETKTLYIILDITRQDAGQTGLNIEVSK